MHPLRVETESLHRIPASWYTVAESRELKPGALLPVQLAGIALVLYRTADNSVHAIEDRCPHLGGQFSAGGRVVGNDIQCPIHRFRFNPQGHCTGTGYVSDTAAPVAKACVKPWHVLDINDLILVWYHPQGDAPHWQPPALDWEQWTPHQVFRNVFSSHPQVVMEGIADQGHLHTVHGYEDVAMATDFVTDQHQIRVDYRFVNTGALPGQNALMNWLSQFFSQRLLVTFSYQAWGMGYSHTEVNIPQLGVVMRNLVNPTPRDAQQCELFYSMAIRTIEDPGKISPLMKLLPTTLVNRIMLNAMVKGFRHDVEDDIAVWSHMQPPHKPHLTKGDGPVHKYRKWAAQFYVAEWLAHDA